jgi:endonuclease I
MRGNNPLGVVRTVEWESTNGSRRGPSLQCGYDEDVFEPRDEFKGDLARGLLYMATRYADEDQDWQGSDAAAGASLEPWAEEVLRYWHIVDPVDSTEAARNDAVHAAQGNRNPFIDHPEWVCQVEDF